MKFSKQIKGFIVTSLLLVFSFSAPHFLFAQRPENDAQSNLGQQNAVNFAGLGSHDVGTNQYYVTDGKYSLLYSKNNTPDYNDDTLVGIAPFNQSTVGNPGSYTVESIPKSDEAAIRSLFNGYAGNSDNYDSFAQQSTNFTNTAIGHAVTPPSNGNDGVCLGGGFAGIGIQFHPLNCLSQLGYYMLSLFGTLLTLVGIAFNFIVDITLVKMSQTIFGISAIGIGWKAFRDIANVTFIFILLYIAIGTILRLFSAKDLLVKLIIAALLINFSLFFTKVIIDGSNLLAVNFHNLILVNSTTPGQTATLGDAFMSPFRLQTLATPPANGITDPAQAFAAGSNPLPTFVMGSIFMFVAIFVFIAACILFLARFAILVILMVVSPLAFAGSILPKTRPYAHQWWSALFNNAFFAPIFFIMIWFVLKVVNDDGFKAAMGLSSSSLSTVGNPGGGNAMPIILNFGIVIAFLIASIIISKMMGAYGSGLAIKTFNNLKERGQRAVGGATFGAVGLAARYSVGRGAQNYLDSERGKADRTSGNILRRAQYAVNRSLAKSSFDARSTGVVKKTVGEPLGAGVGKGGYQKVKEERKKRMQEEYKKQGELTTNERDEIDHYVVQKQQAQKEQQAMGEIDVTNPDGTTVKRKTQIQQRDNLIKEKDKASNESGALQSEIDRQLTIKHTAELGKTNGRISTAEADATIAAADRKITEADEKKKVSDQRLKNLTDEIDKLNTVMKPLDNRFTELKEAIDNYDSNIKKVESRGKTRQEAYINEEMRKSVFNLWMPSKDLAQAIRKEAGKSREERALQTLGDAIKKQNENSGGGGGHGSGSGAGASVGSAHIPPSH